jgi:hypothetical protein
VACLKLLVGVCNEVRGEILTSFLNVLLPKIVALTENRELVSEVFNHLPLMLKYLSRGLVTEAARVFEI